MILFCCCCCCFLFVLFFLLKYRKASCGFVQKPIIGLQSKAAELHKDVQTAYCLPSSNATDKSRCNRIIIIQNLTYLISVRTWDSFTATIARLSLEFRMQEVIEGNYKKPLHASRATTTLFLKKQRNNVTLALTITLMKRTICFIVYPFSCNASLSTRSYNTHGTL